MTIDVLKQARDALRESREQIKAWNDWFNKNNIQSQTMPRGGSFDAMGDNYDAIMLLNAEIARLQAETHSALPESDLPFVGKL